jgi:hypothetical protein
MNEPRKRRWYQFSLKTLLVGMTVLCIGPGGYVAYEQAKARKQMAAFRTVNKYGGYFASDGKTPARSKWAGLILGDDSAANLTSVLFVRSHSDGRIFTFQDDCLEHLTKLPKIQDVSLTNIAISDAGLVHLAKLKSLKAVSLKNTKVTDAGVAELQKALPNCDIQR